MDALMCVGQFAQKNTAGFAANCGLGYSSLTVNDRAKGRAAITVASSPWLHPHQFEWFLKAY